MGRPLDKSDVAALMRDMDICFMVTKDGANLCSRPMSNNKDVDWTGDNWFFSNGDTRKVAQLRGDPTVELTFSGSSDWLSLRGAAVLHQNDRPLLESHWLPELEQWFPDGLDTPGLTLIQVRSKEAEMFGRSGEGIVTLS